MNDQQNTAPATQDERRFATANFTAETVETKTDSRGKPYIRARGSILRKGKEPIVRTVKAEGRAMDAIKDVLKEGVPIRLRGMYSRVANDDGSQGGEFFVCTGLAKTRQAA